MSKLFFHDLECYSCLSLNNNKSITDPLIIPWFDHLISWKTLNTPIDVDLLLFLQIKWKIMMLYHCLNHNSPFPLDSIHFWFCFSGSSSSTYKTSSTEKCWDDVENHSWRWCGVKWEKWNRSLSFSWFLFSSCFPIGCSNFFPSFHFC